MEKTPVSPRIYRFGLFELSVEAGELRKDGLRLKLQDQPFQILCTLLEHPGKLITREQLRQQLWPEGTFVDFEHGLNTAIKKIRDVLSDDADIPRYIETIPRKGYRFIGSLTRDGSKTVPATPHRSSRPWQSRTALLVAGLGLVVGIAALGFRWISDPPLLRVSGTKQLTFSGHLSGDSGIESDGRRVYYIKHGDGNLYSVPVDGGSETSYTTRFGEPIILHISPDGTRLLVKEALGPAGAPAGRIWLLPTNGGPARPLGDVEADAAAWSPDGKTIAFTQHNAIYLTENEGISFRRLAETTDNVSWIRWAQDGQRLRFTVLDSKTFVSSTWEADRNGKTRSIEKELGANLDTCCGFWTRDGRHFLFRELRDERTDYWITQDSWSPLRSRKPFPLSGGGVEMTAATASPSENVFFMVGNQTSFAVSSYDLAARRLTPFLPELSLGTPAFSPDGKWMAVCQVHTRQRVLWLARSDGTEWLQLTDAKMKVHHARFSPDGKRIALMGKWEGGPWRIYWVSARGGALHELNMPIASQADPNWMPDNESILFGQPPRFFAEPDSPRAIYIHNLLTNSVSKVRGSEGWFSPRISPDGRSFLALSIDEHKLSVYDFALSEWRVLLDDPQRRFIVPSWSPDGQWAFINVQYGRDNSVMRVRVRDRRTEDVLSFRDLIASPECWAWGFAPDGTLMIGNVRPNSDIYALRYE